MIPLVGRTIPNSDIDALSDWLREYPRLTKGDLTKKFEFEFSDWLGTDYSTYVNSGSSANLIALYALMCQGRLRPGDFVGVPALSWATDLAPVIQLGLVPVLIDCDLETLSVSAAALEVAMSRTPLKALILVHVLGIPANLDVILEICRDIVLIEDCCEAQGSSYAGDHLGTYGDVSTFSFFFGHHMSTIEGGMVSTSDAALNKILVSLRSHGWTRDWPDAADGFDERFKFVYPGFNLRNTEIGAFIGLRQLEAFENNCNVRRVLYSQYDSNVKTKWKPPVDDVRDTVPFAYPHIADNRDELLGALSDVCETRPLISGSHTLQPVMKWVNDIHSGHGHHKSGIINCPNAEYVHNHGFYVPLCPGMTTNDVMRIARVLNVGG